MSSSSPWRITTCGIRPGTRCTGAMIRGRCAMRTTWAIATAWCSTRTIRTSSIPTVRTSRTARPGATCHRPRPHGRRRAIRVRLRLAAAPLRAVAPRPRRARRLRAARPRRLRAAARPRRLRPAARRRLRPAARLRRRPAARLRRRAAAALRAAARRNRLMSVSRSIRLTG